MSDPLVSVVMGTYNHAPFVAESIRSVLRQDFTDFEFLIADDGSKDGTAGIVAAETDPRVHFTPHAINRGAALVLNELVQRARGRYVAVINSDDAWLPSKLSEQVGILNDRPEVGAVFGRVRFVDRTGWEIAKETLGFGHVFDQDNRSRGAWLYQFFFHGNCLCHPTVLIRRDLYGKAGLYDNRLRQLPDFDMWIRLIKYADIVISPNAMINFRILPGENTSSDTSANRNRTWNEHFFIALDFFSDVSADILRDGFGPLLRHPELPSAAHVEIEKVLLFLQPIADLGKVYQLVALMKLRSLLGGDMCREVLKRDYGFDDHALHRLESEADVLQPQPIAAGPVAEPSATVESRLVVLRRGYRDVADTRTIELGRIILRRLTTRARQLRHRL